MRQRNRRRSLFELLEERRLLTAQWDGGPAGAGTEWNEAVNWVGDVLPGPTDDVLIDPVTDVTITHSAGQSSIRSLYSTQPLVLSGGKLTVSTTLQVDNIFRLAGGTLATATVLPGNAGQGITFTSAGGRLDGVTAASDLDLASNSGASVHIVNGLTLDNATVYVGNAAGSTYGQLYFDNTEMLGGTGAVVFGKNGNNGIYIDYATTVTLGPDITVRGSSGSVRNVWGNGTIVNQGTIVADDSGGISSFAYDSGFDGGWTTATAAAVDVSGVTDPAPQVVYQTAREYPGGYTLPHLTPSASYTLRLHFAELGNLGVNQRKFHVDLNGTRVLTDFDIVAAAGGVNKAVVREFTATADAAGTIRVVFTYGNNLPLINGIEVLSGGTVVQAINCGLTAGGTITIQPGTVTNQGTLQARQGGTLNVSGLTGNLNTASLTDAGSNLSISGTNWVNNQACSVPSGTTLSFGGTWTNSSTIGCHCYARERSHCWSPATLVCGGSWRA